MKFYKSENFSKNSKKIIYFQSSNILISAVFVAYYSINRRSIENLIKNNLEKSLKLNFLNAFLKKRSGPVLKEFHGFQDYLKII